MKDTFLNILVIVVIVLAFVPIILNIIKTGIKESFKEIRIERLKYYFKQDWLSLLILLLSLIIGVYYWNLPVNDGRPHWISGKGKDILNSMGLVFGLYVYYFIGRIILFKKGYTVKEIKLFNTSITLILIVFFISQYFSLNSSYLNIALNKTETGLFFGALSFLLGNYLPKMRKDELKIKYDKKIYSDEIIRKTNRIIGKVLVVYGLLCLIYSFPSYIGIINSDSYNSINKYIPLGFVLIYIFATVLKKRYQIAFENNKNI